MRNTCAHVVLVVLHVDALEARMSQSSRHVVAAPRRANAQTGRMTSMMMAHGNVQRRCSSKPLSAAGQMRGGNLSFCFPRPSLSLLHALHADESLPLTTRAPIRAALPARVYLTNPGRSLRQQAAPTSHRPT